MTMFFSARRAMTMIEVIVVVGVIVILAGMILPHFSRQRADHRPLSCLNNLRSVGMAFRIYANDGEPYPQFSPTNEAWTYFQVVGKEIGSPRVLLCPGDTDRSKSALDFESHGGSNSLAYPDFQNKAVSYSYGTDVEETNPGAILASDRNISTNGQIHTGVLLLQTNASVSWTKDIHTDRGNVVLADGSAQMLNTTRLRAQLPQTTNSFVRFVLP